MMNMMENEAKKLILFAHLLSISKLSFFFFPLTRSSTLYHKNLLSLKKLSIYIEEFHSSWSNLNNIFHYLTLSGPVDRENALP